jgi:hypothetical protein
MKPSAAMSQRLRCRVFESCPHPQAASMALIQLFRPEVLATKLILGLLMGQLLFIHSHTSPIRVLWSKLLLLIRSVSIVTAHVGRVDDGMPNPIAVDGRVRSALQESAWTSQPRWSISRVFEGVSRGEAEGRCNGDQEMMSLVDCREHDALRCVQYCRSKQASIW